MGFIRKKETKLEKQFKEYLFYNYEHIKQIFFMSGDEKFIRKYDLTDADKKNTADKIRKAFSDHMGRIYRNQQRIYLRDLEMYCELLDITPNDILNIARDRKMNTINGYYHYFDGSFEKIIIQMKKDGLEIFTKTPFDGVRILPVAFHVYTGTTLYALIDFNSVKNDTSYFVTCYTPERLAKFAVPLPEKGRYSRYARIKIISDKGDKNLKEVMDNYRKLCSSLLKENREYLITLKEKLSRFPGYSQLLESSCYFQEMMNTEEHNKEQTKDSKG